MVNNSVSRKTVSDSQKKQILDRFNNGSTIKDIADDFQFTIPTITRQLKPINSVDLPNVVFIIVDSNIELQPKLLKDYAFWSFLPEKDLCRNTLEIFSEQRSAKKFCSKNQKIIKVPNPNVFLIASEVLKKKGITRIIFDQLLLSL